MSYFQMSDDQREFYRKMFMYGPWLVKDLARLAYCFSTFYQAQLSGSDIAIRLEKIAPTFSGFVLDYNNPKRNEAYKFNDLQDLEIILERCIKEEALDAEG